MFVLKFNFFLGVFMNTNGSRNWLLWLAIILAVVAVVYVVRNRMMVKQDVVAQQVDAMEESVDAVETNVDAVPSSEVAPEPTAEPVE